MHLPILQLSCRLFWQSITSPRFVSPPTAQIWLPATSGFPKVKIAVEREDICKCNHYTLHRLSQQRLSADCLIPRESDCSWMHSKVSSDWLPSYIKATGPVLEIFKMAGYFPDSPHKMSGNVPTCLSRVHGVWYSLLLYSADHSDGSMNNLIEVSLSPVITTKNIALSSVRIQFTLQSRQLHTELPTGNR